MSINAHGWLFSTAQFLVHRKFTISPLEKWGGKLILLCILERKGAKAMKKKKNATKVNRPMRCPYCGSVMELRRASDIYHDPLSTGLMYVCNHYPACNTYVRTQPGTTIPLGTPANGELRNLRIRAHREFDKLWHQGLMSRETAYRWLADFFGIQMKDAHIGKCGEYQCKALIEKCQELRAFRAQHAV